MPKAVSNPTTNAATVHKTEKYTEESLSKLNPKFYEKYVKNLQGKDFMTYNGLIALAKDKGLLSISSEVIAFPSKDNNWTCIIQATVTGLEDVNGDMKEVQYSGIGDANVDNCNRQVGKHFIRMAETRAKGRALRDYLGIDMVMSEELCDVYEDANTSYGKPAYTPEPAISPEQVSTISKLMSAKHFSKKDMQEMAVEICGTNDMKSFTFNMAEHFIDVVSKKPAANAQA